VIEFLPIRSPLDVAAAIAKGSKRIVRGEEREMQQADSKRRGEREAARGEK
jgi:hypothetical protein